MLGGTIWVESKVGIGSTFYFTLPYNNESKDNSAVQNTFSSIATSNMVKNLKILMDIQMPILGGYEATIKIRQFNKEVIIIAQTAFGISGDREKAIEAGCNNYIAKPIKKFELLSLIQKYFMN